MTLRDAIARIQKLDPTASIYASPLPGWSPASRCAVIVEPVDGSLPASAAGLTFMLDVAVAKQVIRIWMRTRPGLEPSVDDLCEAVIYFARFDAHQPALAV